MKALYFDCFSGISGDMVLGALLDLGISKEVFLEELKKLDLKGYKIEINKIEKCGINGTDVDIKIDNEYTEMVNKLGEHLSKKANDDLTHTHGRHLSMIEEMIDRSNLKQNVKDLSKKIFLEIAKAEAKVHNKEIEQIHFHEVGAVDSIVDIVGAAICLEILGITKIMSSPVHDGQGFIKCQHGTIPVPVPAVMQMLIDSNIPFVCENIPTELVTPTGMGILKCISGFFGNMPEMIINKVGYGFGKKEIGKLNALRLVVGDLLEQDSLTKEAINMFETTIDDMTSEMMGFVMEKLFNAGALDVYYSSIYMKKNRLAFKLTVLAKESQKDIVLKILFEETTTLGVRVTIANRIIMDREIKSITTEFGAIRVKIAKRDEFIKYSPEYEDCKIAADKYNQPLWKVYNIVNKNVGNDL